MQADLRRRLELVLSAPTAPFHEELVHERLRGAARSSARLRAREDAHGNLEIVYGRGRPKLLFACHTDHPALETNGDGTATVRGGMRPDNLVGAALRTFSGEDGIAVSRVVRKGPPLVVRLRGGRALKRGTPLVLDLPAVRFTQRHVRARAIDDLCAVAACLTAADRLARARWVGTVGFLFTRAEEVGFAGALGWVRSTRYPRSTTIVNLEMSRALPHTPQGHGPILRVGDRVATFSPEVALGLEMAASGLARRGRGFRFQRALMDRGGCEATVFSLAGFPTGALCLPLKNVHNHTPSGGLGPEYVHRDDVENLVRWMVAYARGFARLDPRKTWKGRLEKLWRKHRKRLGGAA